jgi:hypothetical protein
LKKVITEHTLKFDKVAGPLNPAPNLASLAGCLSFNYYALADGIAVLLTLLGKWGESHVLSLLNGNGLSNCYLSMPEKPGKVQMTFFY